MITGKRRNISISVNELLCMLSFAIILFPRGLRNWSNTIYLLATIVNILIFIILIGINIYRTKIRLSCYCVIFIIMLIYFAVIQMILSPRNLATSIRTEIIPIAEAFFGIYWITRKDYFRGIKLLSLLGRIWLILNFFSVILFPRGLFRSSAGATRTRANWFFGSKNNLCIYIVVCFSLIILDMYLNRRDKNLFLRYTFYSICALFPIIMCGDDELGFLTGSSTGIIATLMLFILGAYILFLSNKNWSNIINILFNPIFIIIIIVLVYIVLLFGFSSNFSISSIITGIFGKSVTFSGRTNIWANAMKYIASSPIFGYGRVTITFRQGVTSVYNLVLRTIISYGVIGIVLFIIAVISSWLNSKASFQIKRLYIVIIAAIFIIGLMYEISTYYVIIFTSLMYFYKSRTSDLVEGS